jgi:two-component system phosphate regulon sensor histidine kinase PhoR
VLADEDKLKWAMQQLVDNAVKFTPGGGRVTLSAAPDSRRVRLSVQDTGIGIAANRLEDIFDDFRQLDGSSTRHFGGTGLGLSLVRRIIEAHGARIHVESREGRGSLFAFSLPTANLTPAT